MIKYKNKEIYEVTIASTLSQYKGSHIDNDIVLFDNLAKIPFPDRTRRMQCMMAALCLNGRATYRLDTIEHTVERNDVIIITNGMVVDNCSFSEDFSGIGFTIYQIMNRDNRKKNRAETIFTDFIALIEKNFRTERRVSWYGRQLCITPKYLSECIKQVSQRTPNEWIDNYVIMELRVQIKNSRKSIKQIAMDMNFPSQSFMGKYFKEHVGMSPTEYRRS